MIKRDEGTGPMKDGRLLPYRDSVGLLTIGYGRNIDERGISQEEADYMLSNDLADTIKEAHSFPWYQGLSEERKAVICNMIFNLGLSRFKGFKKTIQYIESCDFDKAAIEMQDSKWARQVGPRATRLSKIMKTGEF